jgi:hypothetical protein
MLRQLTTRITVDFGIDRHKTRRQQTAVVLIARCDDENKPAGGAVFLTVACAEGLINSARRSVQRNDIE